MTESKKLIVALERGDYAAAFKLSLPLAERGGAEAQYNLGFMYNHGLGVSRDEAEAATWYRKAAERGHAAAQSKLAIMYDDGEGIARDYAEAVKWYRKAAEHGDVYAQSLLGVTYEDGCGVAQDLNRAEIAGGYYV